MSTWSARCILCSKFFLILQPVSDSAEQYCYAYETHVVAQQIVPERVIDCSFLAEERFRNIHTLVLQDCCNLDGGLLADIVVFLNELKHLNLRNSSVSQYNVLTISKRALQLKFLDANCDKFLFAVAYVVLANIKPLQQFDCGVLFPLEELSDWKRLVGIFGIRVKFGCEISRKIRFWSRYIEEQGQMSLNRAVEQ